ncbi:MAG: stalk domain-containing protein [Bacillota bacterium]
MKKYVCLFLFLILVSAGFGAGSRSEAAVAGASANLEITTPVKTVAPEKVKSPVKTLPANPGTTRILEPIDPENIPLLLDKDIKLINPGGGEAFQRKQPLIIEFLVKTPGTYKILCSHDSGKTWTQLGFATTTGSRGLFPWFVNFSESQFTGHFRIKIVSASDSSLYDVSGDCNVSRVWWDGFFPTADCSYNSATLTWKHAFKTSLVSAYDIYKSTSPDDSSYSLLVKNVLPSDCPVDKLITYTDHDVINGSKYYYKIVPLVDGHSYDYFFYQVTATTPRGVIVLTIGEPYMTVNGRSREIEPGRGTVPVVVKDRTFVPIRGIVEAMGGTVSWDGLSSKITINYNNNTIILQIGSTKAIVNGAPRKMDVAPFLSETGSTMLPVRYVAEYLGCRVDWDAAEQRVIITYY